jgi:hypothetical protein
MRVVDGVSEWCLVGIEPSGRDEFGVSVGDADAPFLGVDEAVVCIAEEREIGEGGGSAVGPVNNVVAIAPARRTIATGKCTTTVPGD